MGLYVQDFVSLCLLNVPMCAGFGHTATIGWFVLKNEQFCVKNVALFSRDIYLVYYWQQYCGFKHNTTGQTFVDKMKVKEVMYARIWQPKFFCQHTYVLKIMVLHKPFCSYSEKQNSENLTLHMNVKNTFELPLNRLHKVPLLTWKHLKQMTLSSTFWKTKSRYIMKI